MDNFKVFRRTMAITIVALLGALGVVQEASNNGQGEVFLTLEQSGR